LLGLEDFNQYVSGFTENIENYININLDDGVKFKELSQKRKVMETDRINIETACKNRTSLDLEKEPLVRESGLAMSFEEIEAYLHGCEEKKGRLTDIDHEIQNIGHIHYESDSLKVIIENCVALRLPTLIGALGIEELSLSASQD
jgi:hypothetical protein